MGILTSYHRATEDRLHQPYRIPLIPGAEAAMSAAREAGAIAVVLAGAGPSLLAFIEIKPKGKQSGIPCWLLSGVLD